ncbi:sugar phosphate isomerase/epimerase family protein [Calidithermus chliarophilus]|uniref:sugar phosphate isomerase/epimerase family protein n=1 Tax=Calidithermus chliarophilus TaxID=52023 RepID=UPI0004233470|nr:sugar phosphate isomerase/epimerase family protein [Calidithermus chliarophilus]
MNNPVVFNTANFAYRQAGYPGVNDWGLACRTTRLHLTPVETYEERFDAIVAEVQAMGFDTLDLWTEHLALRWLTPEHIELAARVLGRRGMKVVSMAGGFGATVEEFDLSCRIARRLGARILGGGLDLLKTDRAAVVEKLEQYDLVYGFENHPEKTPEEVLEKVGDAEGGRIGVCIDTGWFGTQGYDAAEAIRRLGGRLVNVHLKDVLREGTHETCRYGRGVVSIRRCLQALKEVGYSGPIDVEHEPEGFDPEADLKASHALLRQWMKEIA